MLGYVVVAVVVGIAGLLGGYAWRSRIAANAGPPVSREEFNRLRRTEIALRESEQRFRFLAENTADVIWQQDANMRFTYVNDADFRMRGYPRDEVLGRYSLDLFTAEGRRIVQGVLAQRKEAEERGEKQLTLRFEAPQRRKDGRIIWVEVATTPIYDDEGAIIGFNGVTRDITQSKRTQDELRSLATTDELTGLSNRRHFIEIAQREIKRAARLKHGLSIALVDLDRFKQINDSHGHSVGDVALVEFARIGLTQVREIDVIARFGGDEFALLLPEATKAQACDVVERFRGALSATPITAEGVRLALTMSAGVATLGSAETSLDTLLASADRAMYAAKQAGGNRVASTSSGGSGTGA
jgi:diguanylate cyclase (GGDEF)-like protein/PAS domain S-box-containing protein